MAMERANLPYLQVYASDFHAPDTELEQGLAALMPEGRRYRICSAGDLSSQIKLGDVDFVLRMLLPPSLLAELRSVVHTSEIHSSMRISYAVLCFKSKKL